MARYELIAFFAGFPLIYSIVRVIAPDRLPADDPRRRLTLISPVAYAVLCTLYLGFQLRNLYPDYSVQHIGMAIRQNDLRLWGASGVLFWIPALRRRPVLCLIHSLVIFAVVVADVILPAVVAPYPADRLRNDMSMYTVSLLLNAGVYMLAWLFSVLIARRINRNHDQLHSSR